MFQIDPSEQFPFLRQSPIVEAVIHWQARAMSWQESDVTSELTKELQSFTVRKPIHRSRFSAQFRPDGSSNSSEIGWYGLRCETSDKLNVAQLTRDGVIFSRLKPYEHWESFISEALRTWRVFSRIAKPAQIDRLAVRFINVVSPVQLTQLDQCLNKYPQSLETIGLPLTEFLHQSKHSVPGFPLGVSLIQTIQPPVDIESNDYGLILDIEVFTNHTIESNNDRTQMERLEQMRWIKDKVFFSLIREDVIQSFK